MGKIKGWVKIDNISWENKNSGLLLNIYNPSKNTIFTNIDLWGVWITYDESDPKILKEFKIKEDAFRYTIKYMKSHPRG